MPVLSPNRVRLEQESLQEGSSIDESSRQELSTVNIQKDQSIFTDNDILDDDISKPAALVSDGKIKALFENGFSFTKLELQRLLAITPNESHSSKITNNILTIGGTKRTIQHPTDVGNQNAAVQELKTALKTVLEEVDELKKNCCQVERNYKQSTMQATYDLRQSMNILFKLQQQTSLLEKVSVEKDKLKIDKMRLRDRVALKDRERRVVELELVEKTKEIESCQSEIARLHELLASTARHNVDARSAARTFAERKTSKTNPPLNTISALYRLREALTMQRASSDMIGTNELMDAISYVESLHQELDALREENARLKAEMEIHFSERAFYRSPMSQTPVHIPTSPSETFLLKVQVEQKFEAERARRMEAEARLAEAEMDWNLVSEQVQSEKESKNRKIVEMGKLLEEYIAANRDLAVRLEETLSERDMFQEAARRR